MEVAKHIPQEWVQQRVAQQIADFLVPPFVEKIEEVPSERISECIVTNVPVGKQHQALTVQTEQKALEVPQSQYPDQVIDVLVVTQQPQLQSIDRFVDVQVVRQRRVLTILKVKSRTSTRSRMCQLFCVAKCPPSRQLRRRWPQSQLRCLVYDHGHSSALVSSLREPSVQSHLLRQWLQLCSCWSQSTSL